MEKYKELFQKILTGNCILFTGSGFSFGSKNINGLSPKTGNNLTKLLYEQSGIDENDNNLKSASEFFIDTNGEHKLIELLKNEFTISETSESHKFIASLPWKRIYTTNYDNVIELAYRETGKLLTPATLNDRIDFYKDKRTIAIHLNGYIDRLTPPSLSSDFKLTNTSYLSTDFVNSKWIDLFRNDFESSSVIVFIGFSLNEDLDLSRIISTLTKRKNVLFIIKPNESILNTKKLEKFGIPLDIGIDGFVELLKQEKKEFIPPEFIKTELKSFRKVINFDTIPKLKDIDVINLFFKGDYNEKLIQYSITDSNKYIYFVEREEINEIIEYINDGGRNILIHSDLGNGKTLLLNGLARKLNNLGYSVYFFNKYFDQTFNEIEQLCSLDTKVVIIIENYSNYFDILKKIALFRTNSIVIVSERSNINDTVFYSLEETLFTDSYLTKDINKLNNQEIIKLINILSQYGLWGKYSKYSFESKRRLITYDCNSSLRLLLLKLLDSPDIKSRFNEILEKVKDANESFFQATLLILSSNLFDFRMDIDDLIYILDDDLLNNPAFSTNDWLKEMIDFNNYRMKARSSILAESLLSKNKYHKVLLELLIKVVKKLDYNRYDRNKYQILKSIVNFSRLQSIFNLNENHKFKPMVLNFFEEVKNTYYAKKNPFFWLQYAIARLSTRDYAISKKYFDTAYSLAEKNENFDTFQIDNHYARQLLENEIYNGDIATCMEQFLKAHSILSNRTDKNKNRHYTFRVASNYGKFYDKYYPDLEEQDKIIFIQSCKEILFKVEDYKKTVDKTRWNKSVIICENEITRILIDK